MKPENPGPPEITITVHAPSVPEPMTFTWPKTKKVGEAADEAAAAFGLTAEEATFQDSDGEVLDREKPLVAAGVHDGDVLDLVSAGGGVAMTAEEQSAATAKEVTVVTVEEELPAIRAYAKRHGWKVDWDAELLHLSFLGVHPKSNDMFRVVADVTGYRALPPAWSVDDPTGKRSPGNFFPKQGKLPNGRGSIFHNNRVICAPFNRLAYSKHGGPHSNWGGPESWLEFNNKKGEVRAFRLADMFAILVAHLSVSEGMH